MRKCIVTVSLVMVVMTAISCSMLSGILPSGSDSGSGSSSGPGSGFGSVLEDIAQSTSIGDSTGGDEESGALSIIQLSGEGKRTFSVGWSWLTRIPSKDFTVVGIIVVRNVQMPSVELMNAARALNADDIINVRVDIERIKNNDTCLAASAVAIKYTTSPYIGGSQNGAQTGGGNPRLGTGAVHWSRYSVIPNKDYSVAGIVTVECKASGTPSADLMEKARELGAHDIINILADTKDGQIIGASAIAIRYTNLIPPAGQIIPVTVR